MFIFLILGVLICCKSAVGICNGNCEEPTLFYDSMKCRPIFSSSDDCCPLRYNCTTSEVLSLNKCYFEGKSYSDLQSVNNDDISANCKIGCTCKLSGYYGVKAEFTCAAVDCPEELTPEPGCHLRYNLNECCHDGQVCTDSNFTCSVEGKTVPIHTKFDHPTEKCTECICDENFTGEFKEPTCRKQKCIEEITNQKKVYSFCAPSYMKLSDCCPSSWVCPQADDQIEEATSTSENKCSFGTILLNIGDKFTRTKGEEQVTCECRIPPYLTCIQNHEYSTKDDDSDSSSSDSECDSEDDDDCDSNDDDSDSYDDSDSDYDR